MATAGKSVCLLASFALVVACVLFLLCLWFLSLAVFAADTPLIPPLVVLPYWRRVWHGASSLSLALSLDSQTRSTPLCSKQADKRTDLLTYLLTLTTDHTQATHTTHNTQARQRQRQRQTEVEMGRHSTPSLRSKPAQLVHRKAGRHTKRAHTHTLS